MTHVLPHQRDTKIIKVEMQKPDVEVLALQLLPLYIQSWVFANKGIGPGDVERLTKLAKDSATIALQEVSK